MPTYHQHFVARNVCSLGADSPDEDTSSWEEIIAIVSYPRLCSSGTFLVRRRPGSSAGYCAADR